MKKFATKLASLTIMTVLFISCTKTDWELPDGEHGENPPPPPPPIEKQLKVVLNNDYLPVSKVDSAIAVWEVNGTSKTIKLQAQGNQLFTNLVNLQQSGTGTLTVQLFSQILEDEKPLQWEIRQSYTLDRNADKVLEGPANLQDPSWNPRAIFKYGTTNNDRFSFIVGIRPNDPYFELKGVKPQYASRIDLIRSFYKETGELVTMGNWVCSASCLDSKGNLVNRDFFQSLPTRLNGKEWSKLRITAYFYITTNPNKAYEYFNFNYHL